ncbi:hypothetical protein EV360DRAFT_80558 [Lentinula raphanica]|nr:hypothetical protein EV360DRAFT_80558 [Lentinula raphanica]
MEGKKQEKRTRRLKATQRTNYAALTPVLCFGIEACFAYQKDSNEGPGIEKDLLPNIATETSTIGYYHKLMLASLVPDAPQSAISKEALFDTFSTLEKLQSALTEHRIDIIISDGKSLCSAMLQFMEKMKAMRGYYDKHQTLEQNMASNGQPSWATLRFVVFERKQSNTGNLIWEPTRRANDKDTTLSLCFDFWEKEPVTKHALYRKLNLRLDVLYVKFRTDHFEKKESMNALWEELTSIKLLEESTRVTIVDDKSLIRAILTHLQKGHWLSLMEEELEINLRKPLLDLLYNERHSGSDADLSASSSTPKRPLPMSSLNTGAPGQNGPSQSHLYPDRPSKMSKRKLERSLLRLLINQTLDSLDSQLPASQNHLVPQRSPRLTFSARF